MLVTSTFIKMFTFHGTGSGQKVENDPFIGYKLHYAQSKTVVIM